MTLAARIAALAELTLRDPGQATRALLAEGVPLPARTLGLLLVSVLSAVLASVQLGALTEPVDPLIAAMTASPFRAALVQWLILGLSVLMIHGVGRFLGGRGNLPDAMLIMVWLQFLLLGPQLLQLVADLISPELAGIIGLVALGLFLWLLTACIAELHGFRSRGLVFLGIIGSSLGAGFVIAFVLILALGPEVFLPNV